MTAVTDQAIVSDREPTEDEREQARLHELLPGWYVWPTMIQSSGTRDWSAMPEGACTAAVSAHSPEDLVQAVRWWNVDDYMREVRAELSKTPADWLNKRELLAANLAAARKLRKARMAGQAK
jgi:hypothetical protein